MTFEKEQYKQENKDLQNQLLQTREDQETLAAQLDQTGHVLDEANLEIRHKEEEAAELQAVLAGKEHEIEDLKAQSELSHGNLCVCVCARRGGEIVCVCVRGGEEIVCVCVCVCACLSLVSVHTVCVH